MRYTVDLHHTEDGVEGRVTREGASEPESFSTWLELLRLLEAPPRDESTESEE